MPTGGEYTRPAPRAERARGVTNGSGDVTFNWPAGAFTGPPVVTLAVEAGAGFRSARIAANTANSTTINVQQSASVTVLGLGVLAVGTAASGVTVHCIAVEP